MAESYAGEVRNGVLVVDAGDPLPFPEGMKVRVEPAEQGLLPDLAEHRPTSDPIPSEEIVHGND